MPSCVHHWIIATPDGREQLPARCRRCGAERTYRATLLDEDEALALTLFGSSRLKKDVMLDRVRQVKKMASARHASVPVSEKLVQRMRQVLRRHGPLTPDEIAEYVPCHPARAERAARERPEFRLCADGLVELAE